MKCQLFSPASITLTMMFTTFETINDLTRNLNKIFVSFSDVTVGISIGLFVLFLGMAIFVYKPKRKRFPVRTTYSEIGRDQPMPV